MAIKALIIALLKSYTPNRFRNINKADKNKSRIAIGKSLFTIYLGS